MKVLVAIDGSEASFNAFRTVCGIAAKIRWHITAFYVNKGQEYTPDQTGWISITEKISNELETLGHELISAAYRIGRELSVPVEGFISRGLPAAEVLKYVDAHGIIKFIALGHSSKKGGAQEFVESTTKNIVTRSHKPVLVTNADVSIRRVLIAVDGSDAAGRAVTFGGGLAKSLAADLGILSVIPSVEAIIGEYGKIAEVPNIEKHIRQSQRALKELSQKAVLGAHDTLRSIGVSPMSMIREGWPADEIITEAGNYDLLVIGTKSGSSQKNMSRIASRILDAAAVTVIFVQ